MLKPRRGRPLVYKVDVQCHSAQMLYSQCNTALNPDLYILFGTAPFFFESSKETSASQTAHSMICDLCRHWKRSRKIRFTMVADRCSLDTQMDELATWLAALEQSVNESDVLIQDMNTMIQQQSETQDQSGGTPISQPELHRERLARVKEFDGNEDKFVVEH